MCPNTARKNEGTCFFSCRSLSSKKEKKIPVKMSQMNAINVLMFHFWHFDLVKQEGSKDRSSDPWIVLCPAVSAAAAGHRAGGRALDNVTLCWVASDPWYSLRRDKKK